MTHMSDQQTEGRAEVESEGVSAQEPEGGADAERRSEGKFGRLSPQEAGRRRWQVQREADAGTQSTKSDAKAETPTDEQAIITALRTAAKGGDVAAARELRAWLDGAAQRGGDATIDTATTYAELSYEDRQRLRARLLREAMEAEGMSPHS